MSASEMVPVMVMGFVMFLILASFVWFGTRNTPPADGAITQRERRQYEQLMAIGESVGLARGIVGCHFFNQKGQVLECNVLNPDSTLVAERLVAAGWKDGGQETVETMFIETGWRRKFTRDDATLNLTCRNPDRSGGCVLSLKVPHHY